MGSARPEKSLGRRSAGEQISDWSKNSIQEQLATCELRDGRFVPSLFQLNPRQTGRRTACLLEVAVGELSVSAVRTIPSTMVNLII
jgi:hypothetical protein